MPVAAEDFRAHVGAEDDEVLAVAADDQVEARCRHGSTSLPSPPLMLSSPPASRDDVVAVAAVDDVVAEAAFEAVVAAVAEERVVADAGDEDVVAASVPPSTTWSPPV